MKYGFLFNEIFAELTTAHQTYRAVRAICRLYDEGELELSDMQLILAQRLERSLRGFRHVGSEIVFASLPLMEARRLVTTLRKTERFTV